MDNAAGETFSAIEHKRADDVVACAVVYCQMELAAEVAVQVLGALDARLNDEGQFFLIFDSFYGSDFGIINTISRSSGGLHNT